MKKCTVMAKSNYLFLFLLPLLLSSCFETTNDYYSGIIVDELDRPVANVLVKEDLVDAYAFKKLTDNNGYFKFKRNEGVLPDIILSKEGFETDTIPMVWTHAGESIEYSDLIKKDSSRFILKGRNRGELVFEHREVPKPSFGSVTNPEYTTDKLFGVWLVNGDKIPEGFKLDKETYYAFGYKGNRYMRYTINYDTLTVYKDDYYYSRKGIIQFVENGKLAIRWNNGGIITYRKRK